MLPAPDTRAGGYQGAYRAVRHGPDLGGFLEGNRLWFSLGLSVQSLLLSPLARKSLLLPAGAGGMCCLFTFSLLHPTNLPAPQS